MNMNRKDRRNLAKNLGLLKNKDVPTAAERLAGWTSYDKMISRFQKSNEMGEQIHMQNLEKWENALINAASEREANMIQNHIDAGGTEAEIKAIIKNNKEIAEKRRKKQLKKSNKRFIEALEAEEVENQMLAKREANRKERQKIAADKKATTAIMDGANKIAYIKSRRACNKSNELYRRSM